jgi:hypothetical protein
MESACPRYLPLVVVVQERPWQEQEALMSQDGRSACLAGGIVQPTQVATHTLGSEGGPDNAACHGAACRASIAVGENRLGSSRRQSMDSVVAPYLRVLDSERRAGTNVGCIPETSLIELKKDLGCNRTWA